MRHGKTWLITWKQSRSDQHENLAPPPVPAFLLLSGIICMYTGLPHHPMPFVFVVLICDASKITTRNVCRETTQNIKHNSHASQIKTQNIKHNSHASQIKTKKTKGMGWRGSAQCLHTLHSVLSIQIHTGGGVIGGPFPAFHGKCYGFPAFRSFFFMFSVHFPGFHHSLFLVFRRICFLFPVFRHFFRAFPAFRHYI